MGKISFGRCLAGGVVAGILVNISEFVLNGVVLKDSWASVMKALGRPMVESGGAMAVWVGWAFVYGLASVWLYAAIRPRFGPGVGTALKAGLVAWLLADVLGAVAMGNMGIVPTNLLVTSAAWSLFESLIATVVGAWIYREPGPAAA